MTYWIVRDTYDETYLTHTGTWTTYRQNSRLFTTEADARGRTLGLRKALNEIIVEPYLKEEH